MAAVPGPPNPAAQPLPPTPPQIRPGAKPDEIRTMVTAQQKQQADGLVPLASKLQEVIASIGTTSQDMRDSFNALYKTYNDAVDDRKHAVTDTSTAVDASKDAALKVAQKEQQLAEAKQLAAEAERKKAEAESKFNQLQAQQEQLQRQATAAVAEAAALQASNRQLVQLHQSQIVDIHTNIQTLAKLRDELEKLHSGIKYVHQQAVALGCIKLYVKYPLLIKARQIALNPPGGQTIINPNVSPITEQYIKAASANLLPIILASLKESESQIRDIIQHLTAVSPPQPPPTFPFWTNYLNKVMHTEDFLNEMVRETRYTWLDFLVYCWTIETLPPTALPIGKVDQVVANKIVQIESIAFAGNFSNP